MENPTINPTIEHMDIVERIEKVRQNIAEMRRNAQRQRIENLRRENAEMRRNAQSHKNCVSPGDMKRCYHEGREDAFLFALQMMDIWLPKND